MDNLQQTIFVPPLASYEQRLHWACGRRGVLPSAFDVVVTRDTSFARGKRGHCRLCDTIMNGDPKTMSRHTESVRHMKNIADFLGVTYTSLCPDEIYCEICGSRFAGNRGDVLTRHLASHCPGAKESYHKDDILDTPEHGMPCRSNTPHTLTRRSKPPAKAEQWRKAAAVCPPLELVVSPLPRLSRPPNPRARHLLETAAEYDTTTPPSENALSSDDNDDDTDAFFATPLPRSTTTSTSPSSLSPPLSLSPCPSLPLIPRTTNEKAADDTPDSCITLPPLDGILAGDFLLPPLSFIPVKRTAESVSLPPCSSFDQDELRARIGPMPPWGVLRYFAASKRDFNRAGD